MVHCIYALSQWVSGKMEQDNIHSGKRQPDSCSFDFPILGACCFVQLLVFESLVTLGKFGRLTSLMLVWLTP